MKRIKIARKVFEKGVGILDKVVGSVEPINRRVYFYTKKGLLLAYASDGCLSASVALGRAEEFEDFYVAPLDNLKLLIKGRNEDVEMRFSNKFEIVTGPEYMVITHPYARDPRKKGAFAAKIEVNRREFCHTLDRGSIILREGQEVIVGARNGRFFLLCEENAHVSAAFMNISMDEFLARVPYESVRHLLKALEILSQEKIIIGNSKDFIGLKFSYGIMTMCKLDATDVNPKDVENFLKFGESRGIQVERKLLKEGASLSSKFHRKSGGRGYIEFSDKLRIGVLSSYSAYEYSRPIDTTLKAKFPILPVKLNQFLSRIPDRKITVTVRNNTLLFIAKNAIFAVKK